MQQPISFAPSAQASSSGTATFTVPSVPISQTWIGTLSIPGAPSSASFSALIGGLSSGNWIGQNTFGPITIPQNLNLQVTATSLTPGQSYQLNFQGTVYTSEEALPSFAFPAATPVSQQTLQAQIYLGTAVTNATLSTTQLITLDPTWRSIWVLTKGGYNLTATGISLPYLTGTTSQVIFDAMSPPYITTTFGTIYQQFFRIPIIPALDQTVTLTMPIDATGSAATYFWGADTAPVDTAVYDESTNLTVTANQSTAANLQTTASQPTASLLNATVVQPTAANLNARVAQPTASLLNATVVQSTAANLQAQVSQSTPANLQVTVNNTTSGAQNFAQLRQAFNFSGTNYEAVVPVYQYAGETKVTQTATTSRVLLVSAPILSRNVLKAISISGGAATNYCQIWDASSGGNLIVTINALSNTLLLDGISTQTNLYLVGSTTGMSVTLIYDPNVNIPNFSNA